MIIKKIFIDNLVYIIIKKSHIKHKSNMNQTSLVMFMTVL